MLITRAADIGLRALMVLAGRPTQPTTINKLAAELSVPERHLGKVIQRLAAAQLVDTTRGRNGGLQISPTGLAATAADALLAVEGNRPAVNCYDPICPLATADCRLQALLAGAQGAFVAHLATTSIAELGAP